MTLMALSLAAGLAGRDLRLGVNGKSDYGIVLPAVPTDVEQTAARELAEHLALVIGAKLPIRHEGQAAPETAPKAIYVGATAAIAAAFPELRLAELPADTIVMESKGDLLYLAGEPIRGTLYAVYTFLEEQIGVRWWTSTEQTIPQKPNLTVPELHVRYSPVLFCRETHYKDAYADVFSARLKNNGHFANTSPAYGGHTSIIGFCHTFSQFMPASKYFADHPEWFSLYEGERHGTDDLNYQLCLTNEEMTQEFIKVCLERIAADPKAGMISVSQNDAYFCGACQCAECQKLVQENDSESGPLIYFVNKVAAAIEEKYPNFLVETLAYSYTRKPPKKIRPRHNVVIRLCLALDCAHAIENGSRDIQVAARQEINEWSAIAPKLYIWQYLANYGNYLIPYPSYGHHDRDIRYLIDHHMVGTFQQGDLYTTTGDFVRPRAWIIAHLLWNPQLKERDLAMEFFNGYYGAAGPFLLAYADRMQATAANSDSTLSFGSAVPADFASKSLIENGLSLFDKALAAVADNEELTARVRRERMPLVLMALNRHIATATRLHFQGGEPTPEDFLLPNALQLAEEYHALNAKWNNQFISEGATIGTFTQGLIDQLRAPAYVPEACIGIAPDRFDVVRKNSFILYGEGNWASWMDDPAASDGRAATLAGNHPQWAIQAKCHDFPADQYWSLCILARCEGNAEDGDAFSFGNYHERKDEGEQSLHTVSVKDCKGKTYKLFKTKPFRFGGGGGYIWVCPPNRPLEEVSRIYVDQIFLMREGAPAVD